MIIEEFSSGLVHNAKCTMDLFIKLGQAFRQAGRGFGNVGNSLRSCVLGWWCGGASGSLGSGVASGGIGGRSWLRRWIFSSGSCGGTEARERQGGRRGWGLNRVGSTLGTVGVVECNTLGTVIGVDGVLCGGPWGLSWMVADVRRL